MQNNPPQQPPVQPPEYQPGSSSQSFQPPSMQPPNVSFPSSQPAQPTPPGTHWFSFSQIRGHPVVDVSTGEKIGEVGDLLLNAERRMVEAFATKVGLLHLHGPEVIPAASASIGADAITFRPGGQGQPDHAALKALPKVSDMIGVHVLTNTGRLLGTVDDARFDQNTKMLLALEVKPADAGIERHVLGGGNLVVPLESVISLGENYMVDAKVLS